MRTIKQCAKFDQNKQKKTAQKSEVFIEGIALTQCNKQHQTVMC